MSRKGYGWKTVVLAVVMLLVLCGMTAFAGEGSGDNSLSSLGITTEGAVVSPEFYYSTIEYEVTVPAGTARLELEPTTSNANAWIVDITGQDLTDGKTTVVITVSAENGSQYSYYLYVTADESAGTVAAETESETVTEAETEPETEPETEDSRYVKVDRNSLEEAENTIATLKAETSSYRDRVSLLTKIMYGLIALSVILLFVVINLMLKKKDLKDELAEYREYGYGEGPEDAPVNTGDYSETQGYGGVPDYDDGQGYYVEEKPEEPPKKKKEVRRESGRMKDDPATVPKPSRARKKAKEMPQYEETEHSGRIYQEAEEADVQRSGSGRRHSQNLEHSRQEQPEMTQGRQKQSGQAQNQERRQSQSRRQPQTQNNDLEQPRRRQQLARQPQVHEPGRAEGAKDDVEVTMIDL